MDTDTFYNRPTPFGFGSKRTHKRKGKQNSIEADLELVNAYLQNGGSITKLPNGYAEDYFLSEHAAEYR